jgi:hypothetical protein
LRPALRQLTLLLREWAQRVTQPGAVHTASPIKAVAPPAVAEWWVMGGALAEANLVTQTAAMALSGGVR